MNTELAFKLGQLIGALQDFLVRVQTKEYIQEDIDRIRTLTKDVSKKFFESGQ
jgi:hypothetical protein